MRRWITWLLLALAAIAALAGCGWWYLHSRDFEQRIRQYVTARVAAATGARVSIAHFHLRLHPLEITMRGVTLRGREPAGQPPLASIARARLKLRLTSLFLPRVSLSEASFDQPIVHLEISASGETNLPQPPPSHGAGVSIFQLGITRLNLRRGKLFLGDRRLPLNAELRRLRLRLSSAAGGFDGRLRIARSRLRFDGGPPAWQRVKVRFKLQPKWLQIDSLHATGKGLNLQLSGRLQSFARPRFLGQAILQAQLPPLLRLLPQGSQPRWLRGAQGEAAVHASIEWRPVSWRLQGGMAAQGLRLFTQEKPFAMQASFAADEKGIEVSRLAASGWDGELTAQAHYTPGKRLSAQGRLTHLRLMPLLRLAAWFVSKQRVQSPRLQAWLNGSFDLRAAAPFRKNLQIGLHLRAQPARAAAMTESKNAKPSFPIGGSLSAQIQPFARAGRIRQLQITLPATHLEAAGSFSRRKLDINLRLRCRHLSVYAGMLAARGMTTPRGELRLTGRAGGSFSAPSFQGVVMAQRLRYRGLQLDRAALQGTLGPRQITLERLRLRQGQASLNATGSAALQNYRLQANSRVNLQVTVAKLNLQRTAAELRQPVRVQGRLDAALRIRGTAANPQGSGEISGTNLMLWGEPAPRVAAKLNLAQGWIRLTQFEAQTAAGKIGGSLSYEPRLRRYHVDLATPGLLIAAIPQLQSPRLRITGLIRAHLRGRGELAQPAGELSIEGINLRGAGEPLGQLQANLAAANGVARLNASDQLPGGDLLLSAVNSLRSPYLLNARLSLKDYDADAWLRRFTSLHLTGHSQLSGVATLQGPLARPQELVAQVQLTKFEISAEHLTLGNAGPIELSLNRNRLALNRFHLAGADSELRAQGSIGLGAQRPLQLTVNGTLGLGMLHRVSPRTLASGRLLLTMKIAGTLRRPQTSGTARIENATLVHSGLPLALDHLNARLQLEGNRMTVEKFSARAGGGQLQATGYAAYGAGGLSYELGIIGETLRMRYQGISATTDLDLHLAGHGATGLLTGDATLTRLSLTPQFDLAVFIANRRGASINPAADSPLNRLRLDMHLVTGPQLQVTSSAARIETQADLRVRGSVAQPILLGRVMASAGRLLFAGNSYRVDKADVEFADPFRIHPLLNVALSTTVDQYEITLNISGPIDKLNLTYRSNPPLTNADIIALLATGHTAESAGMSQQATGTFVGQSEQLLGTALENAAANQVQRMFGITRIMINPNIGSAYNSGSGTITIEQQISPAITFTYTQNLSTSSQDIIQVTWELGRHFGLVISRDQFGIYGLSFHFHHRAR